MFHIRSSSKIQVMLNLSQLILVFKNMPQIFKVITSKLVVHALLALTYISTTQTNYIVIEVAIVTIREIAILDLTNQVCQTAGTCH